MLAETAYGKSSVRLVKVARHGDRHDLTDLTVAIRFEGDYDRSYTDGDNHDVLPTDTMKNTVYALAAEHAIAEPESFGVSGTRSYIVSRSICRSTRGAGFPSERTSTARRSCTTGPSAEPRVCRVAVIGCSSAPVSRVS